MKPLMSLLALALSGCFLTGKATTYTSDIAAAAQSEWLTASVELVTQVTSEQECKKEAEELSVSLSAAFNAVTFGECIELGMESGAAFSAEISLGKTTNTGLSLTATQQESGIALSLRLDPNAWKAAEAALPMMATMPKPEDLTLAVEVIHDGRDGPVTFITRQIFVNGKPGIAEAEHTLERRESIQFKLSNLQTTALLNGTFIPLATMIE